MVSLSSFFYLLLLQQMLQVVIACDALQFILHNLLHLLLDAPVVRLYRFLHSVVAVLVREIGNDRNFLVGTFLPFDLFGIHHNLAVENLLLDTFVEIVRHGPDEHSLRERRDLRGRDQAVQLRGYGCRFVAAAQRHALPLLQYLTEPFRECLGRFTYDLPGEDVAHRVHHDGGLLVPVIPLQL